MYRNNEERSFIFYIDLYKDAELKVSRTLAEFLLSQRIKVLIDAEFAEAVGDIVARLHELFPEGSQMIQALSDYLSELKTAGGEQAEIVVHMQKSCYAYIAVGGDGTFLAATHRALAFDLPVVGMRLGRLGFLATLTEENYVRQLKRIIAGDCVVAACLLLTCSIYNEESSYRNDLPAAKYLIFNDLAVNRKNGQRIAKINLEIDDTYVDTIPADGIVVCTPNGSTAYALSAGGAIIDATCEVMEISPICPHTMHNRSYVVRSDSTVHIYFPQDQVDNLCVAIDGKLSEDLTPQSHIIIKKAQQVSKLLQFKDMGVFVNLADKLSGR